MALSGSFSNAYRGFTYKVSWSASQSVSGNYSTVTCTHQLICAQSYSLYISARTNSCTLGSSTQNFTSAAINTSGNTTITLGTTTHTVSHSSDGTGSFSISSTFNMQATISGTYVSSIVVTGSATLNTIPRASSLTLSTTSVNVDSSITATITSASSSFTHTVEFYINSTYYKKYTGVKTSQAYTIPPSWYAAMPSSTSCTAYCRITTYSGSTQIGSQVTKSFTVNVPSTIVPTVGTITLNPTDINSQNILVQNKNKITVSVSGCSAGTGSSIKSYAISGPGVSYTGTSTSASGGPVTSSGSLTYTVKVTDNRGRTASKTEKITSYAYATPYFKSFNAYRVNSSGIADENGTYIKCDYSLAYSSVNSTNKVTVEIMYKKSSASNYSSTTALSSDTSTSGSKTLSSMDTNSSYNIYATISDSYSGSNTSEAEIVFGATRVLNITRDGTGVAIGKLAESSKLFECRWDAKFDGTASGPSGFSTSSDKRVKKNIQDLDIDIIDKLRPVQYELTKIDDGKIHYGFVAQDVKQILLDEGLDPTQVGVIGNILNNGQQEYVLTYTEFIPLLTKKCQDLQSETDMLKQEIAELKDMIKQISS